ncbi:MAG: YbaB/EbfC family nucleoid-associated protein [Deltaproteobacteria bacterium]|jgi:DNA-binding YbaB/EbfC family protein|nr:YbaB/EbfC family nucleoid-associated protein [Deltaproteobacteria bacterium]
MSNEESPLNLNLVKQAKVIQEKMMQLLKVTNQKTVTASSGGGMVIVTANGANQLVSIKIDKQVVNPDDIEMLTDLLISAANQALAEVQSMISEEMANISGGFVLPNMDRT